MGRVARDFCAHIGYTWKHFAYNPQAEENVHEMEIAKKMQ